MSHIAEIFTEENTTPPKVVFMAILAWGILYINQLYGIVSVFTALNSLIVCLTFIILPKMQAPSEPRILTMEQLVPENT